MKFEWETISENITVSYGEVTKRAYVPGGWVIKNLSWGQCAEKSETQSESMTFVPDPMHLWRPHQDIMDGVL